MMIPAGCIRISPAPCPDAGGSSSGLRSPGDFASRHPGLRGTDDWRVVPGPRADQRVSGRHGNNGNNATPLYTGLRLDMSDMCFPLFAPDIPEYFLGKVV